MGNGEEHTPEPWVVGGGVPGGDSVHSYDTQIVGLIDIGGRRAEFILASFNGNFETLSRANAARAVACVNALAGWDIEEARSVLDSASEEQIEKDLQELRVEVERLVDDRTMQLKEERDSLDRRVQEQAASNAKMAESLRRVCEENDALRLGYGHIIRTMRETIERFRPALKAGVMPPEPASPSASSASSAVNLSSRPGGGA